MSPKESTPKQHGLRCCPSPRSVALCAQAALPEGSRRRGCSPYRQGSGWAPSCYGDSGAAYLRMRGPLRRASGRRESSLERGAEQGRWIVTCRRWRAWARFPCPISGTLMITLPVGLYFSSKAYIFEGTLGMSDRDSYFYAAIVAVVAVHVVLALFVYVAWNEGSRQWREGKQD
ncbi:vacuolar ATPase assembly integral membrane protein VMA21 isoform X1 [Lathamus discolor]|uniref:vacuolar ATPase assembly integral membrane protein VMA21 isoform X1 n=1 Tax=Lathamus discolor TaxID=678569 RepID=UPI0032B72C98